MNDYQTEELLSAYVDGELTPTESACMADAIARDPRLATRVALLTRVKYSLSDLAVEPPDGIPLPDSRWSRPMLAIAASVGLFVAVMSGIMTGFLDFGADRGGWYQRAAATHAEWAQEPAAPGAREIDANLYLASVDRLHLSFQAPDLTSANLRLTYLRFYEAVENSTAAMHMGYTGQHGCRLTMWVTRAPSSLGTDLTEVRDGKTRSFRWRAGKVAYALFATGMAEQRFTTIADKVHQATRVMHGFDDETRMALNDISRKAPPCAA
ncbi:MAG: hypothetical protein OEY16_01520 [Alphaproteobacteria bacterium]|nr:hypothetical protein [Alphaproteobacteria bacterium]